MEEFHGPDSVGRTERFIAPSECDTFYEYKLWYDQIILAGDGRSNQHYGILLYNQMFTRFHNYLADTLLKVNPDWPDEKLYEEARRIVVAVNQILVYRDYLPALLGTFYFARKFFSFWAVRFD